MTLLAGDLGGTKTLLALCSDDGEPLVVSRFDSHAYDGLAAMVQAFLSGQAGLVAERGRPARAAFGVAGPITELPDGNQRAIITNLHYAIETAALGERCGLARVRLCNDFYAVALAVAHAAAQPDGEAARRLDLVPLNPGGRAAPCGNVAVLGAGTGMGQALIARSVEPPVILPTEGGHSDFAPRNELEADLLRFLLRRYPEHVSVERVLSGAGLVALYDFFCDRGAAPEQPDVRAELGAESPGAPAVISQHALAKSDRLCALALDRFVQLYGAEAGNLALKSLATGGVYLAGGIAAKILPKMTDGTFLANFIAKGRFTELLRGIPVCLIKNPQIGLLGAAHLAASL
ncbi:MAG: glucokinase [Polyangia bacterium]